jgi:DivIVA domain-containing protein
VASAGRFGRIDGSAHLTACSHGIAAVIVPVLMRICAIWVDDSVIWGDSRAMGSWHHRAADGHGAMIARIENARFTIVSSRAGYDEEQVDKFLDLVLEILRGSGSLAPELVRDARFTVVRERPSYAQDEVDALLGEIEQYAGGRR